MKSFSDSLECATQLYVAERLAGYGTRPPIIANLCGIQIKKAKLMYGDILGRSPPSGMLPSDTYWILRSSVNCVHASIFYQIYTHILAEVENSKKLNYALAFVSAYSLYLKCINNNPAPCKLEQHDGDQNRLDINRAFDIIRQAKNGDVALRLCKKCNSEHLVLSFYPEQLKGCPICDVWADKSGRRRWMNSKAMQYSNQDKRKDKTGTLDVRRTL